MLMKKSCKPQKKGLVETLDWRIGLFDSGGFDFFDFGFG
jgi:hypothetical protein